MGPRKAWRGGLRAVIGDKVTENKESQGTYVSLLSYWSGLGIPGPRRRRRRRFRGECPHIQPPFMFRCLCTVAPRLPRCSERGGEGPGVAWFSATTEAGCSALRHPVGCSFLGRSSCGDARRPLSETTCDATPLARRLYKNQIVGAYPGRHAVWRVR